jgi:hypothetical protein
MVGEARLEEIGDRQVVGLALEHFQSLETQQNVLIAPPNVRDILRKLHKAKKQRLDQSEELAEEWANTGGDVDEFVQSFIHLRSIHRQRAAKMELLQRRPSMQI